MAMTDKLSQLTMDEKLLLLVGRDNWTTEPIERLGIPSIRVSDGPHGLRKEYVKEDGSAGTVDSTCFPTGSALAATWNPPLVREVGAALGDEAAAGGVDVLLGPAVNIKRTPLCGRNFEYYSEDPWLAGELAASYIQGVQSRGVGTSLKHYAANNQEFDRGQVSVEADERALREIYLKVFEIAVRAAQPWTVMCSYNRLDGIYASESSFLLDRVLRRDFGFEGVVMSDWGAVHDRPRALAASLEMEMPHRRESHAALEAALRRGEISEGEVNRAAAGMLRLIQQAVDGRTRRVTSYDRDAHHALARRAALEAVTLLKNDDEVLPVSPAKVKRLAVLGSFAEQPSFQGGGSSHVFTTRGEGSLGRLRELAAKAGVRLTYHPLIRPRSASTAVEGMHDALVAVSEADLAVLFVGTDHRLESEEFDRTTIRLPPGIERVIELAAEQNPNTVVVVQAGSAIDMSAWIDKVKGVVFAWFGGESGGPAVADVLFGIANPCGKTAESFPDSIEDTPAHETYPGTGGATWYREGILVGYRYYDTDGLEVLFPFGHGLSYTTFEYSGLAVTPGEAGPGTDLVVSFRVRNSGTRAGQEVAQLYVSDLVPRVLRPAKELRAFAKVDLAPEESKEVRLTLRHDAFAYWNRSLGEWHVRSGDYQLLVGSSSRDIRLERRVKVQSARDFS